LKEEQEEEDFAYTTRSVARKPLCDALSRVSVQPKIKG